MSKMRLVCGLVMGFGVSACATYDNPSRNATPEPVAVNAPVPAPSVRIAEYSVEVPASLRVSEANRYYPGGDIVWRGDPLGQGTRHAQVQKIFETSLGRSAQSVAGETPVRVDVVVRRFHALTQKARYTVGGIHAITFDLTLRDPVSGEVLGPTRSIRADLEGYGGGRAIAAESQGITQKVRITEHLDKVIQQELTQPGTYHNAELGSGFMQAINRL